jgi:uncharacterized protein (DUF433 family)
MPSKVVSLRVSAHQAQRLRRKAQRLGRSPSETGALLLEEALRRDEFAFIDFRDSPRGRQAFIQGARLPVWMVAHIARDFGNDVSKTAAHLEQPAVHIQAALNYAEAFPAEIKEAIEDHKSYDFTKISRLLPQARRFEVSSKKRG